MTVIRLASTGLPGRCLSCDHPAVSGSEHCQSCQADRLEAAKERIRMARYRLEYETPPLCGKCGESYEVATFEDEPLCYRHYVEARTGADPQPVLMEVL